MITYIYVDGRRRRYHQKEEVIGEAKGRQAARQDGRQGRNRPGGLLGRPAEIAADCIGGKRTMRKRKRNY